MKNFKDFDILNFKFRDVILKNLETDSHEFFMDVINFMSKNNFFSQVIHNFYDDDDVKIIFFTDHPENNDGIVFMQIRDSVKSDRYQMYSFAGKYNDLMMWVLIAKKSVKNQNRNPFCL